MLKLFHLTRTCALILLASVIFHPTSVSAQGVMRIAAVVNDDVISAHDLAQRIRLTIATTRLPDTPEVRQRLASTVLRTMIDERMKRQAAEKEGIEVSDEQIQKGLSSFAASLKIPADKLPVALAQNGIDIEVVKEQAEAEIAWTLYLNRVGGQRTQVLESEIDLAMAAQEANKGKPEYNFLEIFIPVESPDEDAPARQMAERLVSHIQNGSPFEAIARDFSKSPSATDGGVVGWVQSGNLDPILEEALSRVSVGGLTNPIRTAAGYFILQLADKRVSGEEKQDEIITLGQIMLPLDPAKNGEDVPAVTEQARQLAYQVNSCQEMKPLADTIPGTNSSVIENLKLSTMAPELRQALQNVNKGQLTLFERKGVAIMVLMVCERETAADTPDVAIRRTIENRLRQEKIARESRRLLQQERRAAFVDIRL